jgi:hypothetical protein
MATISVFVERVDEDAVRDLAEEAGALDDGSTGARGRLDDEPVEVIAIPVVVEQSIVHAARGPPAKMKREPARELVVPRRRSRTTHRHREDAVSHASDRHRRLVPAVLPELARVRDIDRRADVEAERRQRDAKRVFDRFATPRA